jgi:Delta7-sterol 5-desaturase
MSRRTPLEAVALFLSQNVALFCSSLSFGRFAQRRWSHRRVTEPVNNRPGETLLVGISVIVNTLITWVGWWLWRNGNIAIDPRIGWRTVTDALAMVVVLDFAMYVAHRVAHLARLYPLVHQTHHRFTDPRTLTLFALHPLESLGFGASWVLILWGASQVGLRFNAAGVACFAMMNLMFGTLGHLGVEPLSDRIRSSPLFRIIATPSFHVGHHVNPNYNLGFFTTIWDRTFGTVDPAYDPYRTTAFPSVAQEIF